MRKGLSFGHLKVYDSCLLADFRLDLHRWLRIKNAGPSFHILKFVVVLFSFSIKTFAQQSKRRFKRKSTKPLNSKVHQPRTISISRSAETTGKQ